MNYTPLYIKSDNSFLSSLIKIDDLVLYAKENNLKSLALADNNLFGSMDFYMQAIKNNIKPIIGLELKILKNVVVLYAKNFNGYKNLIKLNKIISEREVTFNDLLLYKDDLICLIPFKFKNVLDKMRKIYADIYITYENEYEKGNILDKSLYMKETLCLKKEELSYLKYLDMLKENSEETNIEYNDNYMILDSKLFNENNMRFSDLCNLEIPLNQKLVPHFKNDLNISSYDYLKKLCIDGLKHRFGNIVSKEYQVRLKYELDVINKMHFCDYFLIVSDYVKYAKNNNILVGPGRGSAVSSLVAYLLDVTEIDPIKNNLLFERFLNVDRKTMPDIDIDFEHLKREDVINYCINKYGEESVMPIISFGTYGARQIIRELGDVLDVNQIVLNDISKLIDSNLNIKENLKNKDLFEYIKNNHLEKFINIASKLEGLKHHISLHAAGVVMSSNNLDCNIPVINYNGKLITGIDMKYLEDIGILKMDFLAIKFLTIVHEMIDDINKKYNANLSFSSIPLDDIKTYEIFKNGYTMGVFQFESDGMINFLRKLKPSTFDDLSAAMALYRPGPMKNIDIYIDNKNNKSEIRYINIALKDILENTNGVLIYQEQIMQLAIKLASFTPSDADNLRKAMSKKKKDLLLSLKEKFIDGCLNNNISSSDANKIYELMLKFAEYGFNKSHSYGYSLLSYRMAYIKAHYPFVFAAKLMAEDMNDKNKLKKYIFEFKQMGIIFLNPDINKSDLVFMGADNKLIYPLTGINGINLAVAKEIINERKNGLFNDIYDFIKRCYNKNINRKIMEILIMSSCFDSFNINKQTLINNLDSIINYGELIKDIDDKKDLRPVLKEFDEYSIKDILVQEKQLFGLYLSKHPTLEFKEKYNNIINLDQIINYFDKTVDIIVNVDDIREIMTKKNERMCFIKASDEVSTIDLTVFPKTFLKYQNIMINDVIYVRGKVEKRFDQYQIIVDKINVLK